MNITVFKRLLGIMGAALVMSLQLITSAANLPIVHQVTLPAGMTWCDATLINALFDQINGYRTKNGLAILAMDTLGMKDADVRAIQFATYMATHTPGSPGFNPHEGYDTTAASLGYNLISENLAYMTSDPAYIVYAAWQDSLHIAAMLASSANVAGVSCVYYNGTPYWSYEPGIGQSGSTPIPNSPAPNSPSSGTAAVDTEEWAFLTLINNFRAQNGAGPLQISATLQNSSTWMSTDMATNNYASHTDSLGRNPGTRMAAFGYSYVPWGENIAGGYGDAQNTFNQWATACDADASGNCTYAHRSNMLNGSFKVIGIGRAYSATSAYGWYWTTDFGGVVDQIISPGPTPGVAPVITSYSANPASITAGQSATLSWSVSGATTLTIDNGAGDVSTANSKVVAPAQTTTYTLTATNSTGSTKAQATVTVSAAPTVDTQPPTAPSLVSALVKSQTQIDLTWTASSDNVGVTMYQILRNGTALATVSGNLLAYSDSSPTAGTTYTYSIRAYDAAGNYSAASNAIQVTTPAGAPSPSACPAPGNSTFTGCYYGNTTLSGTPALVRNDPAINFDWTYASPGAAIPLTNYSVRWQGYFNFNNALYTFTAIASDGIRVYIDGAIAFDRWGDQPVYTFKFRQYVSAGSHLVTVEYYERTGTASAHVSWQEPAAAGQAPVISSFLATPSTITAGQGSALSWSISGATNISIDQGTGDVSNSSSKTVFPSRTTTYTITASNSSGSASAQTTVNVSAAQTPDTQPPTSPVLGSAAAKAANQVDLAWSPSTDNVGVAGYQVLRNGSPLALVGPAVLSWTDSGASASTTYSYSIKAYDAAGNYSAASNAIRVTTPAGAPATSCAPATGAFTGCYYNNVNLSGVPVLIRTDSQINFDWSSSPGGGVPASNYSVRWQGNFDFADGTYNFSIVGSDGIRLYIDGYPVFDTWRDQPVSMFVIVRSLQGTHLITVEYYEKTGTPAAHVSWQRR